MLGYQDEFDTIYLEGLLKKYTMQLHRLPSRYIYSTLNYTPAFIPPEFTIAETAHLPAKARAFLNPIEKFMETN